MFVTLEYPTQLYFATERFSILSSYIEKARPWIFKYLKDIREGRIVRFEGEIPKLKTLIERYQSLPKSSLEREIQRSLIYLYLLETIYTQNLQPFFLSEALSEEKELFDWASSVDRSQSLKEVLTQLSIKNKSEIQFFTDRVGVEERVEDKRLFMSDHLPAFASIRL